jgi:autotransporter-associated beta strand protein
MPATCRARRPYAALALAAAAATAALAGPARGQSTWTGATGGEWGTSTNWTGGVPNAIGATANINLALTVNVSDTGTGGTYPYTVGTIATTIASGSVVIGNNTVTTDVLRLQVGAGGTPTINVANGGAIFYYANLEGTQGFNKTGGGRLTFRFNGADQTYTGPITISGGILGIEKNSSLGNDDNDITIANGARLLAEPGSNSGTVTLPASRTITLAGAQSQIGANNANVNLIIQGAVGESAAGSGLVKTDAGVLTLAGTLSYTGETRIAGGTLALSSPALLPSGQNLRFTGGAAHTLNVGSTSQTVRTIVMDNTSFNRTITGAGGSLTINGDADLSLPASNGVTYDFSGIDSFTFNRSNRAVVFPVVNVAGTAAIADLNLAKTGTAGGTNTITASTVTVGGGNSDGSNGATFRLHLGTLNTINAGTLGLGAFNSAGLIDFQGGLTSPSLRLRGADGVSAMTTLRVGETSSGTRSGQGVLNLTGGSLDALVTNVIVGRHIAGSSTVFDTSSLTMPSGTLVASTLLLAEKTGGGTPTLTSTFTQGGGTVTINTITLGQQGDGTATPVLLPTYNLSGGTLSAATIQAGAGTFDTTSSSRVLSLNGGTLKNLNSTTDLVVNGRNTSAGGRISVVVGASGGTISADAGRSVTLGLNTNISGTGTLTKTGQGTLFVNGTGNRPVNVTAGTLGGTGTVGGLVTVAPNTLIAPGNNGTGTLTLSGGLTLDGTYDAEINFANDLAVAPSADQIVVSAGTTDLTGGTIRLTLLNAPLGTLATPQTVVLVKNADGVVATNTGVTWVPASASPFVYDILETYNAETGFDTGGNDLAIRISAVPEPGTLSLLALGGLAMLRRRRSA